MRVKKGVIFVFLAVMLLLVFSAYASVEVVKQPVNDVMISELNQPALYEISIKNLGEADTFEIYTLLSGIDILPADKFVIQNGETKKIDAQVYLNNEFRKRTGRINFVYQIRGENSGIQTDIVDLLVVSLADAVKISTDGIDPDSKDMNVYVENKVNANIPNLTMIFNSAFFDANEQKFSLKAFEKKELAIPINKEKSKVLVAGKYILSAETIIGNVKKTFDGQINFVEKSGISTKEISEGFLLKRRTIEKTNDGNLPGVAEIVINKDIISRLFTTFSQIPDKTERSGFNVKYTWVTELKPAEKFTIQASTNYAYPFLILLALLVGLFLIYTFTVSNLVLKKRVSFVRTKGGEFALKVTIAASTRKFVEKIAIVDKLPAMVKIYERFGANPPNKVDERNGRLEWDIERLQPGEERVFSYIIYSKVGIVGRFELPEATAVFERDGKIHESKSNKTYFVNEPLKKSED